MADTVDNRPVPPGPGERQAGPREPQGPPGATDLASRNDRDMPSGPASPGHRWLSPPAAGARLGQRGRPGCPPGPARPSRGRAADRSGPGWRAGGPFVRRHRLGPYLLLLPLDGRHRAGTAVADRSGRRSCPSRTPGLGRVSGAVPAQWVGFRPPPKSWASSAGYPAVRLAALGVLASLRLSLRDGLASRAAGARSCYRP